MQVPENSLGEVTNAPRDEALAICFSAKILERRKRL
jgi:hypothetical protein